MYTVICWGKTQSEADGIFKILFRGMRIVKNKRYVGYHTDRVARLKRRLDKLIGQFFICHFREPTGRSLYAEHQPSAAVIVHFLYIFPFQDPYTRLATPDEIHFSLLYFGEKALALFLIYPP